MREGREECRTRVDYGAKRWSSGPPVLKVTQSLQRGPLGPCASHHLPLVVRHGVPLLPHAALQLSQLRLLSSNLRQDATMCMVNRCARFYTRTHIGGVPGQQQPQEAAKAGRPLHKFHKFAFSYLILTCCSSFLSSTDFSVICSCTREQIH